MLDLEELKLLAEKATPGLWAYRPNEIDYWGIVRGAPDEEGRRWIVAVVRSPYSSEEEKAAHREAGTDPWENTGRFIAATREAVPALIAEVERLREALAVARAWHEAEDKALSKSGRHDSAYYWARAGHMERIRAIKEALPDAEYDAAWKRMNARAAMEDE